MIAPPLPLSLARIAHSHRPQVASKLKGMRPINIVFLQLMPQYQNESGRTDEQATADHISAQESTVDGAMKLLQSGGVRQRLRPSAFALFTLPPLRPFASNAARAVRVARGPTRPLASTCLLVHPRTSTYLHVPRSVAFAFLRWAAL